MNYEDGKNIGLGIGHQITKFEKILMNLILKYFKFISGFLVNKYKEILGKIIFHFKSSKNLSNYSKCAITICLLYLILKIIVKIFRKDKKQIFNKKLSNFLFLKTASNKKFTFSEDKSFYIINRELSYEKIKNYIKSHKQKLMKINIDSNEKIDDPYFKLMKFYIEYNKSNNNNIKKIII
jgi:hypothetical protein